MRHVAEHLQAGIEQRLRRPPDAVDDAEDEADGAADRAGPSGRARVLISVLCKQRAVEQSAARRRPRRRSAPAAAARSAARCARRSPRRREERPAAPRTAPRFRTRARVAPFMTGRPAARSAAGRWRSSRRTVPYWRRPARCRPVLRERQQRHDELGEAVGLLEVRVAGEDEGIDAERHVFLHARGDRLGIADQRGSGAAAHQADARPEVRAHLELVAPPAMQRRHAALADGIHALEDALRRGDRRVVEMADERSAAAHASSVVSRTMTCRRMPKVSGRPVFFARRGDGSIFSPTCAGGSPQVRYLSTCSAATSMPASDEPPK